MAAYTLAAREKTAGDTIICIPSRMGQVKIGTGHCTVIAGSCAVESREQYLPLAEKLKAMGVHILRGGAFKPRSSPYSFQGLGEEGLRILAETRELTGMPVVTEIMDPRDLDKVYNCSDLLQIGSRNMQNFSLLKEVGQIDKPVILKRGLAATIEEWLLAGEYILAAGNQQVILCERGIRTFESMTRNTVDIGAVALVKQISHLPVIVDPSHATGLRSLVIPVARAAIAAGADGLMVEVHLQPDQALSDGPQSLSPEMMESLLKDIRDPRGRVS
ncbi:Phospho-2-dehydro-3-deoxyheptonate aldolase, subtype 2 [Syntrophomonas zehnderi OL-4]|uniref:Phospho-2-dehydro-3-deoxyheptonate aldolase, subtype 2 n=1 Tax=Syntrophomonas zehnderi OL-4 TaxID=690567 RepID=A0A0E4GCI3_9FIRM|nr:3-deoxy-7-phosphoheptulonate synthase [Syntrophomonas zehnderi]CFX98298.1 Phospho-2-dehydro-3-deoxyheptonate aldolase, subtype 2 [Syntrophomonas zehnderi OL-4]